MDSTIPDAHYRLALLLQFQVVARLASDSRVQVQFETSIDGSGQIRLKD